METLEAGEWPLERWHHDEHLVYLTWVLHRDGLEAGLERIRAGIQRHNAARGIEQTADSGYHDTLTIFLVRYAAHLLDGHPGTLLEQLATVREQMSDFRALSRRYYSRDAIMSWEARTGWVPPDLQPLP